MVLASALVLTGKQLRKPLLAVMLAVVIGSFGFDVFTEKVLDIPAGSVGGGPLGADAADGSLCPGLRL